MNRQTITSVVNVGSRAAELPGQTESGDQFIVKENHRGALIGAIDGLGHGFEAAVAAKIAVKTLEANSEESIIRLAEMCHRNLVGTRGAAMALAFIDWENDTLSWLSIGNVDGVLVRIEPHEVVDHERILMRSGVVGFRLPPLSASMFSIKPGDHLILSTDGIRDDYVDLIVTEMRRARFAEVTKGGTAPSTTPSSNRHYANLRSVIAGLAYPSGEAFLASPQNLADYLCDNFTKGTDDALVVAARYNGRK